MPRSCSRCGTAADRDDENLPLGWSSATSPRGLEWLCAACTREHVRAIEAKLAEDWW